MPDSNLFPIRAVARLTGLPLDTLRAWERRYQVVVPKRSRTGRLYSEQDVERLSLLREVVARGHSIGQVAPLPNAKLREFLTAAVTLSSDSTVAAPAVDANPSTGVLRGVLHEIEKFDSVAAERELNRLAIAVANPRVFVHAIALPLMRAAGRLWHEGRWSIAQEHFLSALLTNVLASFLRSYTPSHPATRIVLATPRGEHHGFGILAAAMLAAVGGLGTVHLGTGLPAKDIVSAARQTNADVILLAIEQGHGPELIEELSYVGTKASLRTQLWIGGSEHLPAGEWEGKSRWTLLRNFEDLEQHLVMTGARLPE
ncbi:MAG TPA: MerR family transcriptional regulator [Candidatus Acidoferrales bacterium]